MSTPETAVLLAVSTPNISEEKTREYLDELAFLVDTAGGEAVKQFTQNLQHPDSRTYMGSGKIK
jgi:GTP-binding protein HflX